MTRIVTSDQAHTVLFAAEKEADLLRDDGIRSEWLNERIALLATAISDAHGGPVELDGDTIDLAENYAAEVLAPDPNRRNIA